MKTILLGLIGSMIPVLLIIVLGTAWAHIAITLNWDIQVVDWLAEDQQAK